MAGSLLVLLILFAGDAPAAGPPVARDGDSMAALIRQLGADLASDTATRQKLRTLLAQKKGHSATPDSDDIHEGLWRGVVERVFVDNVDARGNIVPGPTQFHLNTEDSYLQIFFMDEAAGDAASGQRRMIRGYRTGRRVLAMESDEDKGIVLSPDKMRLNGKQ